MGTRQSKLILGVAACVLVGLAVQATVYQVGGRVGADLFNPSTFGRCIYKAVMLINGGKADVNVVACDPGVEDVRAAFVKDERDGTGRYYRGESLGLGMARRDGTTVGVVTLRPEARSQALMVAVSQTDGERLVSKSSEGRHLIESVPVPSGARVHSSLRNLDTRTEFEAVSVRMSPDAVRAYYDAGMARGGWSRVFPASRDGGVQVYVKGTSVCCVGIGPADLDGDTAVTLLHKQGAVK